MPSLKIAVIGAGSFVFGPSVLSQALLEHRLSDIELALVDVDHEVVGLMAGVGRRMAREAGVDADITAHTERPAALEGAGFVICSASRQMHRRFEMDCEIARRHLPDHLISEFGGIAGISYSLRQIALISEIAGDMTQRCPNAWLLNIANPLPRVAQAAHELGIRTAGFCSASLEGYGMLWRIFHNEGLAYPFEAARNAWEVTMGGLNHFCWVTRLRDRASGADLLPAVRDKLRSGASSGNPRSDQMGRETRYLLVPNDSHTKDFLPPQGARSRQSPGHGSPEERWRRLLLLRDIGEGRAPWDELLRHPSWERPIDFVAALARGKPAHFPSLNLINQGQVPGLPLQVFVETPCRASAEGPAAETVELPATVLPYCQQTALVTDTIVRAALERKRALVHQAVELDPTILDKAAGIRAMDECLQAHADILPTYS